MGKNRHKELLIDRREKGWRTMVAAVGSRRSDQYWGSAWRSIWFWVYTVRRWIKINYCTTTLVLSVNAGRHCRRLLSRPVCMCVSVRTHTHTYKQGCCNWLIIRITICFEGILSVSLHYAILLTLPDWSVLPHLCIIILPPSSCIKTTIMGVKTWF